MKLLTTARDLKRRKARESRGLFAAEGVRTCEELLHSGLEVTGALHSDSLTQNPRGAELLQRLESARVPLIAVSDAELASACDTESPQGVIAVARIPQRALADIRLPPPRTGSRSCLLLLDAIQDPGNAGTLVRTAAALGAVGTVALEGTVDLWNAKVVRSAMGTLFTHHAMAASWSEVQSFLTDRHFLLLGATRDGQSVPEAGKLSDRIALAVGNEGAGLSIRVADDVRVQVGVPIRAEVESLNVAVAAGILLSQLCQ